MHSSDHHEYTWTQKVMSAFSFGIVSFVIVFTNKFVLGDHMKCNKCYGFPSVKFLAFAQCAASCMVMMFQKYVLGHLLGNDKYKNLFPPLTWSVVRQISPLPLLFFLNMVSGLSATKSLNIPMFVLLRRFSIAMTLLLEFYILKKTSTTVIVSSVGLMLLGALIAAADDVTLDMFSVFYILMNDLLTAVQGVTLKLKMNRATANEQHQQNSSSNSSSNSNSQHLTTDGILFYNSFLSSVPALIWWLSSPGELNSVIHFAAWTKPGFIFWFTASMFLGFVLNYSYFLCTKYNSALTSTVVGSAKNCISSYVGMMLGDYHFSPVNFVGVNVSMFAAILYAYGELQRQQHPPAKQQQQQPQSIASNASNSTSTNQNNNTAAGYSIISINIPNNNNNGSTKASPLATPIPSGNRLSSSFNNSINNNNNNNNYGGATTSKSTSPHVKGMQLHAPLLQRSPPVKGSTTLSAGFPQQQQQQRSSSGSIGGAGGGTSSGGVTVIQHPNLVQMSHQPHSQHNNCTSHHHGSSTFHFHSMNSNNNNNNNNITSANTFVTIRTATPTPPPSPAVVIQTISSGSYNSNYNSTSSNSQSKTHGI